MIPEPEELVDTGIAAPTTALIIPNILNIARIHLQNRTIIIY